MMEIFFNGPIFTYYWGNSKMILPFDIESKPWLKSFVAVFT